MTNRRVRLAVSPRSPSTHNFSSSRCFNFVKQGNKLSWPFLQRHNHETAIRSYLTSSPTMQISINSRAFCGPAVKIPVARVIPVHAILREEPEGQRSRKMNLPTLTGHEYYFLSNLLKVYSVNRKKKRTRRRNRSEYRLNAKREDVSFSPVPFVR